MGGVWRAYDSALNRQVAIKVLHSEVDASDSTQTRLFLEAQAMAKRSHPNVVSVYEVGSEDNRGYIVMEYVHGQTLSQWLQSEKRSIQETLRLFLLAGRGLAATHREGLVHRDFKPDNVLLGEDGRVCVTDFGLVRFAEGTSPAAGDALPAGSPMVGTLQVAREGGIVGTLSRSNLEV